MSGATTEEGSGTAARLKGGRVCVIRLSARPVLVVVSWDAQVAPRGSLHHGSLAGQRSVERHQHVPTTLHHPPHLPHRHTDTCSRGAYRQSPAAGRAETGRQGGPPYLVFEALVAVGMAGLAPGGDRLHLDIHDGQPHDDDHDTARCTTTVNKTAGRVVVGVWPTYVAYLGSARDASGGPEQVGLQHRRRQPEQQQHQQDDDEASQPGAGACNQAGRQVVVMVVVMGGHAY